MSKTIGIIGGDRRSVFLARQLLADGFSVVTWGLSAFAAPNSTPLEHAVRSDIIVLPIPLSRDGKLNCGERELALEELFSLLAPCQKIFAGGIKDEDRLAAAQHRLMLTDFTAQEEFAVRNVIPTVEGALELAMEAKTDTLHHTPCLVLGFGRIGKLLALRLHALGAKVTVSARKQSDLAWIDALGLKALHTEHLAGQLSPFRLIFNTVPHLILGSDLLRELPKDCILIELASAAGMDRAAAESCGLRLISGKGLPGRCAPESAAAAMEKVILNYWKGEQPE